jgi:tRNA(fMet)-specific endonuclease VapC
VLYLLDTTAFSDAMRDEPGIGARLASLPPADRIAICPVVRGEILYGIERLAHGARRENLKIKATRLFERMICEPIPVTASDHYARIKAACQTSGLALNENDLWIAATAAALEAVLVTRDRDFERIAELRVENWTI